MGLVACATSPSRTARCRAPATSRIRYEQPATNILLRNIVTTGSGQQGFYSSLGTNPPGVTFVNTSFDP